MRDNSCSPWLFMNCTKPIGPLMVLTQKVTSLAFSLHDGLVRKPEDLTPFQKKQLIRKVPNPLEYYSYVFHFHAVMVGPTVLFADYTDFINGKHFSKGHLEAVHICSTTTAYIVLCENISPFYLNFFILEDNFSRS